MRRLSWLCALTVVLWTGQTWSATATAGEAADAAGVQVRDGDMASVLAFRLKPRGASIEQMMVALLRHNPDAFIQGNVNLLRDGAMLRLPPAEEVLRIPADQAREWVLRQHQNALSDLGNTAAVAAPPGPAASEPPSASPPQTEASDRDALLEKLRTAKAHLAELERNIQELERLTREPESAAAPAPLPPEPAAAATGIPNQWLWLGVSAIVAIMVGVGYAQRPQRTPEPPSGPTIDRAAAEFQARLGALDLSLDSSPPATDTAPSPSSLAGRLP